MSTELQKLEAWKKDLALVETFEELKLIGDAAKAYQQMQQRQKIAKGKQDDVGEFIVEVEEQMGSWLDQHYKQGKHENRGNQYQSGKVPEGNLSKMPTTKQLSARARALNNTKAEDPELYEQAKQEIKKSDFVLTPSALYKAIKKENRKKEIEKQGEDIKQGRITLPDGLFEIIVIDPPWNYGRKYDPDGSRVANPYPEMDQEQLLNLPIPAADNCILWLWTTHAFIWDAKELMSAWGFQYKAILTWDKEKIGMGAWLRMQTEFCLLGIKGKPIWNATTIRDIIREPRREHSRKPEAFYEMINENLVGRKLDYFSRSQRPGWECIGNEVTKFESAF